MAIGHEFKEATLPFTCWITWPRSAQKAIGSFVGEAILAASMSQLRQVHLGEKRSFHLRLGNRVDLVGELKEFSSIPVNGSLLKMQITPRD